MQTHETSVGNLRLKRDSPDHSKTQEARRIADAATLSFGHFQDLIMTLTDVHRHVGWGILAQSLMFHP